MEPDTIALALLTAVLLLIGLAGERVEASPPRLETAQLSSAQPEGVFPDGWTRQFDLRREQTIERLNGRMDELRQKLERQERSVQIRLAANA